MEEKTRELFNQSNVQIVELTAKGSVGIAGTLASMSINDFAGLVVAILTAIYMCLQIESAWRNRKAARQNLKKSNDEAK